MMSFFFSSRRRHTRSLCDWSSDVCSSDLLREDRGAGAAVDVGVGGEAEDVGVQVRFRGELDGLRRGGRSEERRVGKECRSLGWRAHYVENYYRESRAE